jgi:uncharacterized membrane protein
VEITQNVFKYLVIVFIAIFFISIVLLGVQRYSYNKRIVALQNQVAERDKTLEVQKDVYSKLMIQSQNMKSLLDSSTASGAA